MFNVFPKCGEYTAIKRVDPGGPFAVCPICQRPHPFGKLPLFVLSRPSGTGTSAICVCLPSALPECMAMETDILLAAVFDDAVPVERLRRRPGQLAVTDDFTEVMRGNSRWCKEHAAATSLAMTILDTTHAPIAESWRTGRWIRARMPAGNKPPEILARSAVIRRNRPRGGLHL